MTETQYCIAADCRRAIETAPQAFCPHCGADQHRPLRAPEASPRSVPLESRWYGSGWGALLGAPAFAWLTRAALAWGHGAGAGGLFLIFLLPLALAAAIALGLLGFWLQHCVARRYPVLLVHVLLAGAGYLAAGICCLVPELRATLVFCAIYTALVAFIPRR